MNILTDEQLAVLKSIAEFTRLFGRSPSYREISKASGVKSLGILSAMLDELECRVFIERTPGKQRSIKVIRVPGYCKCQACGSLVEATAP